MEPDAEPGQTPPADADSPRAPWRMPRPLLAAIIAAVMALQVMVFGPDLLNSYGPEGSPLQRALETHNFRLARVLLICGAKPQGDDSAPSYNTPLCRVVEAGDLDSVRFLLDHGADVEARGSYKLSLLQLAAAMSSPEVVELLLQRGAKVDARTGDGHEMVSAPLPAWTWVAQHGAEPAGRRFANRSDYTALMAACAAGRLDVAQTLLKFGADPNAPDGLGDAALHVAVLGANADLVALLLEHGAKADALGAKGGAPLHLAARYSKLDAGRVLLEHGADPNVRGAFGRTPLHWAPTFWTDGLQAPAFAAMLLDHGANPNARDDGGMTPLHLAVIHRRQDLVRLFTARGGDMNARDGQGRTPAQLSAMAPAQLEALLVDDRRAQFGQTYGTGPEALPYGH